jgi:hypothetical protein
LQIHVTVFRNRGELGGQILEQLGQNRVKMLFFSLKDYPFRFLGG